MEGRRNRSIAPADGSRHELSTRDEILRFIREHPSCHLRKIKTDLGLGMGTVQYHLDRLAKAGSITSQRHGLRKYFFVTGVFRENEKQLLEMISNETVREILLFVVEGTNPSQTEISQHIGITAASTSWHVKRLRALGIVDENRDGKFKRYRLRGEPSQLAALLKTYYPGIWDRWSNRLAEMFLALSAKEDET